MKYFKLDWCSDEEWDKRRTRYWQRIALLSKVFPPSVKRLAHISLHDGLIRWVKVNAEKQRVELHLLAGDLQIGYYNVDLIYTGVQFQYLNTKLFAKLAWDRRTEVQYSEVDVFRGKYVHRINFYPKGEIEIRFTKLTLRKVNQKDRLLEFMGNTYFEE